MLATRHCGTFTATATRPADPTATLVRCFAVATCAVATTATTWFGAKESIPAWFADAFKGFVASAVLAAGKWYALVTLLPAVANPTATFSRTLTVAIHGIAPSTTHGHLAEITLPAGQTLHISLLIACVMRVHFVFLRLLTGPLLPQRYVCVCIKARLATIKVASQSIDGIQCGDHH